MTELFKVGRAHQKKYSKDRNKELFKDYLTLALFILICVSLFVVVINYAMDGCGLSELTRHRISGVQTASIVDEVRKTKLLEILSMEESGGFDFEETKSEEMIESDRGDVGIREDVNERISRPRF